MKNQSLSRKMLTQFTACIAVLLLLATPLFYFLTKHYYAEDMIDIIEAVGQGQPIPTLDLEEDIMHGIMIQFGVITLVLAIALLPSMPAPLAAVQILWVNLVTDAFPALALGVDPKEQDVMSKKPRPKKEGLFAHGMGLFTVLNGMYIGTVTLVAFRFGLQQDIAHAQTMAFMVLSMTQLFHSLNLHYS